MITNSCIYGINLSVPLTEFDEGLEKRSEENGMFYNLEIKHSKKGYKMAHITLKDEDYEQQNAEFLFPVTSDGSNINLIDTSFKEMNNTFYEYQYEEEIMNGTMGYDIDKDPFAMFCEYIKDIATMKNGTFIYKTLFGEPIAIIEGKQKVVSPCVVDIYGKVYGHTIKDDVKADVDFGDIEGMNLKEWLRQHKEEEIIKNILMSDKVTLGKYYDIAKYLITLKQKDELPYPLFKSLFQQAGMLDQFENDTTLNSIYKLLM